MRTDKPAAWLDGWLAHKERVPYDQNPYDFLKQGASAELWEKGWNRRDLSLDNVTFGL